ncbi:MAG TPA: hypothetical protein VH302_03580 [Bryobacteraceae bacterium]|nr:hypothetical protein [Bryobacteraceae bacterium]
MTSRSARCMCTCVRNLLLTALLTAFSTNSQTQPGQLAPDQKTAKLSDSANSANATPQPPPLAATNQAPQTPLEFESHGLSYEALTKNGITVMYAPLPPHIKDFNIIQITVTNGSVLSWTVRPAEFVFIRQDGVVLQPMSADEVVYSLLQKASATDVIKLQLLYEDSIYAVPNFRSTNGYEKRREAAMAQFVNKGLKAAVAASAITMAATRLKPGDSTDGAVFFENRTKDKSLGAGKLVVHTCGESFEFYVLPEVKLR